MPRVYIDNNLVISYEYDTLRDKYWTVLSKYIIQKYGKGEYREHNIVESILLDCFQFLVDEFRNIIIKESSFTFFLYVYFLHEESIKLYQKTLNGLKLEQITESEFSSYRRILKMIIEQGCDVELKWGELPDAKKMKTLDAKVQELNYLGTWIYGFADFIAYHKMIVDCHFISFDKEDLLVIDWQHHYGIVYDKLMTNLYNDYENIVIDQNSVQELADAINNCFNIEYDFAVSQIFEIKKHFSPNGSNLQTISPEALPQNLMANYGISKDIAESFYDGLTLSKRNKLSIENLVYKPYSMNRYMFRPILIYNIGGENRALIGEEKFAESIMVLSTNAIHWNASPEEWSKIKCFRKFIDLKGKEHDKILEDEIEKIIKEKNLLYVRNIKSFKQVDKNNIRIDNPYCGEIDFIIVDQLDEVIHVSEVKYNRARYEGVGFRNDYSNFMRDYESKLKKKVDWIRDNLSILQEHIKIIYGLEELDISKFDIKGVFFINTPTFYMFNGNFKAITLNQLPEMLDGKYKFPEIIFNKGKIDEYIIRHPYFRKPVNNGGK